MTPAALIQGVRNVGGELLLTDSGRIRFSGPDTPQGRELLEQLRSHRDEVMRILRQQRSWPSPLSYAEYFCRMQGAGFVPCSREEWEVEHGSDAERMDRYRRLCRWGASGEQGQPGAVKDAEAGPSQSNETEFAIENHEGENKSERDGGN